MRRTYRIWLSLIRTVPGCLLIGLITLVCYRLELNLSVTGFVYLIVIVFQTLVGDFASSASVSLVAVLCLDFFFVPPLFSFEVTNPLDILALISFLTTGLIITRLTTRVREEAAVSDHQRQQVDRLYQLAQGLLALDPEKTVHTRSIQVFQDVLGLRAVCLFDAAKAEIHCTGNLPDGLADQTRAAYSSGRDSEDVASGVLTRCLRAGGNTIGAIGFEGLHDPELMRSHSGCPCPRVQDSTRDHRHGCRGTSRTRPSVSPTAGTDRDSRNRGFPLKFADLSIAPNGAARSRGTEAATGIHGHGRSGYIRGGPVRRTMDRQKALHSERSASHRGDGRPRATTAGFATAAR